MNIGSMLYKVTGIMTQKEITRRSMQVGKQISQVVAKDGSISVESLQKILSENIGKGIKKVDLVTTKEEMAAGLQRNLGLSEEVSKNFANFCLSASIPGGVDAKNTILNIRVGDLPKEVLANVSAHETEHALFQTFSTEVFESKNPLTKLFANKFVIPMSAEMTQLKVNIEVLLFHDIAKFGNDAVNGWTKYQPTFDGLLKQCKCKTREQLHQKIRKLLYEKKLLCLFDDKRLNFNYAIVLKCVKDSLKDEANAYKVGGAVQKEFYNATHVATGKHATASTMNAMLYEEAIKVINEELTVALKDTFKSMFGIKTAEKSAQRLREKGIEPLIYRPKQS